jgi:hypothetical protein
MRLVFALGTLLLAGVFLGRPASGENKWIRDAPLEISSVAAAKSQ